MLSGVFKRIDFEHALLHLFKLFVYVETHEVFVDLLFYMKAWIHVACRLTQTWVLFLLLRRLLSALAWIFTGNNITFAAYFYFGLTSTEIFRAGLSHVFLLNFCNFYALIYFYTLSLMPVIVVKSISFKFIAYSNLEKLFLFYATYCLILKLSWR